MGLEEEPPFAVAPDPDLSEVLESVPLSAEVLLSDLLSALLVGLSAFLDELSLLIFRLYPD